MATLTFPFQTEPDREAGEFPTEDVGATYLIGENETTVGFASDPYDLVGEFVCLPDACWPGYEESDTSTRCLLAAYSRELDKYVVDTLDGNHYAMTYSDFRPWLRAQPRKLADAARRAARWDRSSRQRADH